MGMKSPTPFYPDAKSQTSLDDGHEFQDFCRPLLAKYGIHAVYYTSKKYQILHGESVGGIEIKLDKRCTETGRLSIEIAEKSKAANTRFIPSGILRDDNTWCYVQGNYEKIFVFSKKLLQMLWRSGRYQKAPTLPTIERFYLSFSDAEKYALFVITVPPEANEQQKAEAA